MNDKRGKTVVRFAPSPTGPLHIGGARTALFNYFFAKRHGGKFILRIEDTDKERSKEEYEKDIFEGLAWLGLEWDEFYRQSERTSIYKKYLKQLISEGKAYVSKEAAKKEARPNDRPVGRGGREEVIRFKNPNVKIKFDDMVRGEIEFDTAELKDFIIARSMEEPLYHLAVVVDDHESGVTHVIRGEDHIPNTPRQILLLEAIGAQRPKYAHIPLILAPDRSKLSKRHGAVALTEFKKEGYLPEAMVNYLALLGWNPGTEEELFSMAALIERFDLGKVQKGGAIFNIEKLKWFNGLYLKKHPELIREAVEKELPQLSKKQCDQVVPVVAERVSALGEIHALIASGDLSFLAPPPSYPKEKLLWKEAGAERIKKHLENLGKELESVEFDAEHLKARVMPYADAHGRGEVLWPFRFALTGKEKSPDPFTVAEVLGKEETLKRLQQAIKLLDVQ